MKLLACPKQAAQLASVCHLPTRNKAVLQVQLVGSCNAKIQFVTTGAILVM